MLIKGLRNNNKTHREKFQTILDKHFLFHTLDTGSVGFTNSINKLIQMLYF